MRIAAYRRALTHARSCATVQVRRSFRQEPTLIHYRAILPLISTLLLAGLGRATGPLSIPRASHQATRLPNGLVLVTGGLTDGNVVTNTAELYDPATDTFRNTRQPALGGGPLLMTTPRILPLCRGSE